MVCSISQRIILIEHNEVKKVQNKCLILFCTFLMLFDIIGYDEVIQRIHMNMENNYKDAA